MNVVDFNQDCFNMETGQIKNVHPRGFYQNVDTPHLCLQIDSCDIVGICMDTDGSLSFVHFMTWLSSGWWGRYRKIERIECKIIG